MMIYIEDLVYSVKKKKILHGISLKVEKGDCMALLGANGAGKSSLIDIMADIVKPDNGSISINGSQYKDEKRNVGVLFEYTPFFYYITVKEWLKYLCTIYNIAFISLGKKISILKIDDILGKQLQVLSKGEKRRVSIVASLLHDPSILILDEPTPDLDPFMRDAVWQLFKASKATILFTTHLWDEAKNYADKVAFIDNGKILASGKVIDFLSGDYLPCNQKIVTNRNNIDQSDIVDGIRYILDDDIIHLYPTDMSFTSELLSRKSIEYSIIDTGLKDVYMFLSKK